MDFRDRATEHVGRRPFLRTVGAAGAFGLAGCVSEVGDEPELDTAAEEMIYEGLQAEGVDPPVETTIYANAENDERLRWAQLVQHALNATDLFDVGFDSLEWSSYEQLCLNMADNEENALITLDISGGWDPHSYVNLLFHSAHQAPNGFNFAHYADDRVDELIDSGLAEADPEKRVELYKELQERLVQQAPISIVRFGEAVTVYRTDAVNEWRQYPLPGSEYEAVYAPYANTSLEHADGEAELVGDLPATVSNPDPVRMNDTTSTMATSLLYEGLLAVDFDGTPRPQLATDWEQLDETTYRFELRDGVEFHNGETLTAEHVHASFERYEGTPRAADVYDWYEGVDIVDDTELEVHLSRSYGPLETRVGVPIVPLAASDGEIDLSEKPIGTGPYRFDEREYGEYWRLERFDDHWFDGDGQVPDQPPVAQLTLRVMSEPSARQAALETGEIDLTTGMPSGSVDRFDDDSDYGVDRTVAGSVDFLAYPLYREPFTNVDVRRGIDRLLPRERIIEDVYAGHGTPGYTAIPPLMAEFADPEFEASIVDEYIE
ncbi:ABC transporter substrate-binding protein [Natrialbaceae archaeon A-arb3/5]